MSRGDKVDGEVADNEGRGTYHRRQVKNEIDLIPLY